MGERERIVGGLAETWASLSELGEQLTEEQWDRPTECPGWTVKDQYSHVIGTESMLLGREAPEVAAAFGEHVRNDVARWNEPWVQARRGRSGREVLDELRAVTDERLAALRAMDDADFAADSFTPVGPGTYADFMRIRLFDCWVHEQDVRRAVGLRGHLEGPAAEESLANAQRSLPRTVGKLAAAPEGSSVAFELSGPLARRWAVGVEGGRGRVLDDVPAAPTATVATDLEAFMGLATGRWRPEEALDGGRVRLGGDEDLARRVVSNLAYTF